jgi:squalene-hopene/tetraprenyl-beta-curcumene cyclase
MKRIHRVVATAAVAAMVFGPICAAPWSFAADAPAGAPVDPGNLAAKAQVTLAKALEFEKSKQQPDGAWHSDEFPAVSSLVLNGLVRSGKFSTKDDFVKKGYEKLFTFQNKEGGIYQDALANYNTAISVSAIAAANDPSFKENLDKAVAFLKRLQWVPNGEKGPKGEQVTDEKNPWYGGFGYGNHTRPDLSNTHFSIEALKDAGMKEDDPAFKAALAFVTRCQNDSETNDQKKFAGDDGGFIYSPTNGEGDSEAEDYVGPDGRKMWRSYGTMTYAGLKSLLYAGVKKDDPRVKAAVDWIEHDWTVDENPGMRLYKPANAKNGLYYYYNAFAKALHAYGEPVITDSKGVKHDWRVELIDKLASTQNPDGSWTGEKRWLENDPVLSTAYAVMALEQAQQDLKEHPVTASR